MLRPSAQSSQKLEKRYFHNNAANIGLVCVDYF